MEIRNLGWFVKEGSISQTLPPSNMVKLKKRFFKRNQ